MTRRPLAAVLIPPAPTDTAIWRWRFDWPAREPEFVSVVDLPERVDRVTAAQILAVAGGFSYADALGSGRVFAVELQHRLGDLLASRVAAGTPMIGICNGFQVLVRTGLLPGPDIGTAALSENIGGRFECRWVQLAPSSNRCIWTRSLPPTVTMPIAHGEGRLQLEPAAYERLVSEDRVAFRYVRPGGVRAAGDYPHNPNGSLDDIAGLCDATGLILGMMPHPENHVLTRQGRSGSISGGEGLALTLFRNGVDYVR